MIYAFGDCELDTDRYELRRDDERRHVEPQVFDVLAYLAAHRDRLVTREELLAQVWGHSFVSEATLSSRLMAARKAIGDSGRTQGLIRTVRGRGYQFVAQVEELGDTPPLPSGPIEVSAESGALVGRDAELAALSDRLDAALAGERQFALVTGEAGAGKTALVERFLAEASSGSPLLVAKGRCLEQRGAVEPYMPILEALGRLSQRAGDGADIAPLLSRLAPTWVSQMPGLVDEEELEAVRARSVGARTDRMLREMAAALDALGSVAPVVLVVDDLHWADESTLALLNHVARGHEPARLLIVGATRPVGAGPVEELRRELRPRRQCTEVALPLLEPDAVRAYLEAHYPGTEALAPTVHERTSGNPLFMDCLLSWWVDVGALSRGNGSWEVPGDDRELALDIPDTLRELLEQELKRLSPEEQGALEVASVAGQDFSAAAIASGLDAGLDEVELCLTDLARRSRFLRDRGAEAWPDGTVAAAFSFVHDLHRQVLYERIPPGRRARVHLEVANRLEAGYGAEAPQRAAELAAHYLEARQSASAVRYLRLAAEQALGRRSHRDAVRDLTTALDLLDRSPDLADRSGHQLRLRAALAGALAATEGFASGAVEEAYRTALELARRLDEQREVAVLLYEFAALHEMRGDYQSSEALLDEALRVEDTARDDTRLLQAHELMACSLFHQGSFHEALVHADRGLARHRLDQQHPASAFHGEDPAASCDDWAGLALWCLGYPDRAMERIEAALELVTEPGREYGLANARMHAARLHQLRREPDQALDHAEATIELARERGFSYQAASGLILQGWALAATGKPDAGMERMREGLSGTQAIGATVDRPYYLALWAEALRTAGRRDAALDAIAEGLELLAGDRTFFYEPELHRLRGALWLERGGEHEADRAESELRTALDMARERDAKGMELRAALSLVPLLGAREATKEALELLHEACEWFGDRVESVDLDEARSLVMRLSESSRSRRRASGSSAWGSGADSRSPSK